MVRFSASILAALSVGAVALPSSAFADPCERTGSDRLVDGGGNLWDLYDDNSGGDYYGVVADGEGVNGGEDAFDEWGTLFVGAQQESATRYADSDSSACATELGGRQHVYKSVPLGGLLVQRRMFTSATGVGLRVLDSLTNPSGAPVTTSVWVGDLRDQEIGDLGSDSATTIMSTSSGDALPTTDDRWAVTSDRLASGSDPAVAVVWGGPGAAVNADFVAFGAAGPMPTVDAPAVTLGADELGWAWRNITVPAGGTVSLMSWLIFNNSSEDGDSAVAVPAAAADAAALQVAPPSRLYEGLSSDQIKSIRNWALPQSSVTLSAPPTAKSGQVVPLSAAVGTPIDACPTTSVEWNLGDGATATGTTVSHAYASAGSKSITLTVRNACGGTSTRTASIDVQPELYVRLFGAKTLNNSYLARRGAGVSIGTGVDGTARVVFVAKGVKIVRRAAVKANVSNIVRTRFTAEQRAALRAAGKLSVRVTVTDAAGKVVSGSASVAIK